MFLVQWYILTVGMLYLSHHSGACVDLLRPPVDSTDPILPAECTCENLTFVTREEWEAVPPRNRQDLTLPAKYYVIYHTVTEQCTEKDECSAVVRSIQKYHMETKNWDDIAYNFLVGGDERVYIGRGWDTVGAHAGSKYYNSHSLGIAVIGNYQTILPTPGVFKVLKLLMECGAEWGYVANSYIIRGHRDVRQIGPTTSPGDALYNKIQQCPQYRKPC